jgi:hypothetical protein
MDIQTDDIRRKRFLWGVCLAWTPFLFLIIPTAIGIFSAFRGMSREKATGLAVLAGGFREFLSTFGLAAVLAFEVAAFILLLRTFSGARPVRALFSVLSICCSGFMLIILGLFLWTVFFLSHH